MNEIQTAFVPNVSVEKAHAYLPRNYAVIGESDDGVYIQGRDNAGWTLDGFVVERLASGGVYGVRPSSAKAATCEARMLQVGDVFRCNGAEDGWHKVTAVDVEHEPGFVWVFAAAGLVGRLTPTETCHLAAL